MMLFAIVFGLSMDYEVFLLSRGREEHDRTGDNSAAVVEGLAGTARVITAAAAIMVAVFASFVLGDLRAIKLIGTGLAAAVLVDATVVRCVLVPATMELLGERNWWLPKWLERITPRLNVEAAPEPERAPELVPIAAYQQTPIDNRGGPRRQRRGPHASGHAWPRTRGCPGEGYRARSRGRSEGLRWRSGRRREQMDAARVV